MTYLLTGGAGYIGAHVIKELGDPANIVVIDDMSSGIKSRLPKEVRLVEGSVIDTDLVRRTLEEHDVDVVIHFAAKKAVGESVERPLYYYDENVGGLASLLAAMELAGTPHIVFSSSAAVYGEPDEPKVIEDSPLVPTSPYGETKVAGEWMVRAQARARERSGSPLSYSLLRYFNVAGAGSLDLGDTSVANLIPLAFRAIDEGVPPKVFGDDYPTADGTCVRDYIHVVDLAKAHVVAAQASLSAAPGDVRATYNIGTGIGYSVTEVLDAVAEATGESFDRDITERRAGDPAELVADASRIRTELGWTAELGLSDMVKSAWDARPGK